MQALRLANRCSINLARLNSSTPDGEPKSTPLPEATASASLPSHIQRNPTVVLRSVDTTLGWDTAQAQYDILLWIAKLYFIKGSPKPVAYFLKQAYELAEHLLAPRMLAKVVVKQAELALALRDTERINETIEELAILAAEDGGLAAIELKRLRACLSALAAEQAEAADNGFANAQSALLKLDKAFIDTEAQIGRCVRSGSLVVTQLTRTCSPRKPAERSSSSADALLSDMVIQIITPYSEFLLRLRQDAPRTQLTDEIAVTNLQQSHRTDEVGHQLQKLANLDLKGHAVIALNSLKAAASLADGMASLRRDPILGLLHESGEPDPRLPIAKH